MNHFVKPSAQSNGLSDAELRLLGAFDHQDVVIESGQDVCPSTSHLHILLDGWAYKYTLLSEGRRQITGLHLSGEICDLNKMCFSALRSSVQAASQCRVAQISTDWLRAAVLKDSATLDLLLSLSVLDNVIASNLIITFGSRTAKERAAWFFCDLEVRLGARGKTSGATFRLPLTQVELSQYLGLTLVHTNRTVQALRSEGLIDGHGATYKIIDAISLRSLARYEADQLLPAEE